MPRKKKRKKLYHVEIWEVDDDVAAADNYSHLSLKEREKEGKATLISEGTQERYCPRDGGGEFSCVVKPQ